MNIIDIVIFISLIIAAISGFIKGFIISAASFIGFFLGIIISFRFAPDVEQFLIAVTGANGVYMYFVAFLICFALTGIIVHIIGKAVEKVVEMAALGFLNRVAGAVFGILKSLLVFSALIYALAYIDPEKRIITPEQQEQSLFYKPLEKILPAVLPFIRHQIDQIEEKIEPEDSKITAFICL